MEHKTYIRALKSILVLVITLCVVSGASVIEGVDIKPKRVSDVNNLYLPIIARPELPPPAPPLLNVIENSDQDNHYTVNWGYTGEPSYTLEESTDPTFSSSYVVYRGSGSSWTVSSPGKLPATYYYRVKGRGDWSNVQAVTIFPMYVGFAAQWDGMGYILTDSYYVVGSHSSRHCDELSDFETIRCVGNSWYDPNPLDWEPEVWINYYSVSTGYFKSSSAPSDPAWKWGYYRVLPYDIVYSNGQTVLIGGQEFTVTGPHLGYTKFGKAVWYWELINKNKFLYHDKGTDWTQYINRGDAKLQYDAGSTRLLLHSDLNRTYYYQGEMSDYYVHYINDLMNSSSFPLSTVSRRNESSERSRDIGIDGQLWNSMDFSR